MSTKVTRTWTVNGEKKVVEVLPLRRLLDVLREDFGIKGTKEGCGEGECGACTILLDGQPVCSCLIGAGQILDGSEIMTVEGLEKTEGGRILQEAYMEKGAAQCGICIPGMLISSYALLNSVSDPDEALIRKSHAGNLCRCTGYEKIVEAIQLAAERWPTGISNIKHRTLIRHR
ncbi:MAG: (2Fe-2S)-binding protein [Verrucomicrobia bacterium]|nr:(2Fe-2S)-binding protein [Verrucomicrobiota bacterium]